MTDPDMRDRAYLVTGGSGSIGRAVADALVMCGAHVAIHGRCQENAMATCEALVAAHGGEVPLALGGDLSLPGTATRLVTDAQERFGRLDGVVNCAVQAPPGITGALEDSDAAHYSALLHDTVTQVQWLLRAGMAAFSGRGGAFVTIVSDAALFAAPNQSLIAASRAAVVAFCRNAALELAAAGVRVNCVSTSYVADSRIMRDLEAAGSSRLASAVRRAGLGLPTCEDVANLCLFLVGPKASRLTGQVVSINGGLNA